MHFHNINQKFLKDRKGLEHSKIDSTNWIYNEGVILD